MKLNRRIHLFSSVLFAVLLIVMNATVYVLFSRLLMNDELERAEAETLAAAALIVQSAGVIADQELLRAYLPLHGMLHIVDDQGNSIAQVTSASELGLTKQAAAFSSALITDNVQNDGKSYVFSSVPVIWSNGKVVNIQMTESIQHTVDSLRALLRVLIIVTVAALIPAVLSGGLLARLLMRPISAMTRTMKSIREGGGFKRVRLEDRTKDELYAMGETFNHMMEKLEQNDERQKRFVSDASHELRTPLTVIESYSSLLLRRMKERPELLEESLEAIHSEAVRMKMMTEQLLQLARREEDWQVERKPIKLYGLLSSIVESFQQAYGREVELQADSSAKEIISTTDEQKLKQLLYIFLDNARKYSEEKIKVQLASNKDGSEIVIIDRGVGIAKADLPHIFDRFYRVEEARSRGTSGAGLGLSLAKELAAALQLSISVDSLIGVGTTVRLVLPETSQMTGDGE